VFDGYLAECRCTPALCVSFSESTLHVFSKEEHKMAISSNPIVQVNSNMMRSFATFWLVFFCRYEAFVLLELAK
jgi:hypothetical protein